MIAIRSASPSGDSPHTAPIAGATVHAQPHGVPRQAKTYYTYVIARRRYHLHNPTLLALHSTHHHGCCSRRDKKHSCAWSNSRPCGTPLPSAHPGHRNGDARCSHRCGDASCSLCGWCRRGHRDAGCCIQTRAAVTEGGVDARCCRKRRRKMLPLLRRGMQSTGTTLDAVASATVV